MRWRRVWCSTALVLLAVGAGFGPLSGTARGGEERDRLYDLLSVFSDALHVIQRAYVEETPIDLLFGGALDGLTDALDPMATYVPRSAVETVRRAREIGAGRSGVALAKDRGTAFAVAIEPGSPAAAAGLRRGDILAKVDGASTREMPLWFLQELFAAPAGTTLQLELLRRGESLALDLPLAEFPPSRPSLKRRRGIPVLRPGRLETAAIDPLHRLLVELTEAGEDDLVLDVRETAGGEAVSAYAAAALFAQGELGRLESRREILARYGNENPPGWSGRLVVLIDRGTQGAAEILARVLVQAAGAELVGERSFGHAGRQAVRELSNGDQLVLTDAFYTGPDGELIDRGLEPHLAVSESSRGFGEADIPLHDLILERALERLLAKEGADREVARGGR